MRTATSGGGGTRGGGVASDGAGGHGERDMVGVVVAGRRGGRGESRHGGRGNERHGGRRECLEKQGTDVAKEAVSVSLTRALLHNFVGGCQKTPSVSEKEGVERDEGAMADRWRCRMEGRAVRVAGC